MTVPTKHLVDTAMFDQCIDVSTKAWHAWHLANPRSCDRCVTCVTCVTSANPKCGVCHVITARSRSYWVHSLKRSEKLLSSSCKWLSSRRSALKSRESGVYCFTVALVTCITYATCDWWSWSTITATCSIQEQVKAVNASNLREINRWQ